MSFPLARHDKVVVLTKKEMKGAVLFLFCVVFFFCFDVGLSRKRREEGGKWEAGGGNNEGKKEVRNGNEGRMGTHAPH